VDAIVFDKTGTLTEAVPVVRRVVCFEPEWDENRLVGCMASAEARFQHPIAKAIVEEAARRELTFAASAAVECQLGMGIEIAGNDGVLRVGSRRYIENIGLTLSSEQAATVREIDARGGTCVLAALNRRVLGLVELQAAARPEALEVIRHLRENRRIREIYLLSGDHRAPTARLAEQLGIEHYFHDVLPAEKVKCIAGLQKRGLRVAMIGDGVNDSAALSQADCGISLHGGAEAAIDAANIVFMDGRLTNLELAFRISENLEANVRTSFRFLVVCNSFLIVGALFGVFGLVSSVVMNNALNVAATLNGLRAQSELKSLEIPALRSA
jgi:Cu2+-exporting ATPase